MNERRKRTGAPSRPGIDQLLGEYQLRVDEGEDVDREEFIRRNPEHEQGLRDYFSDDDKINQAIRDSTYRTQEMETISDLPQRVAGFEVLDVLGSGGMGVVYRARQLSANREVALKTLNIPRVPQQLLKRFKIECDAVSRLQHPHVIQLFDVGEFEGRPFFVMELMEGGSLSDRLDGQEMSLDEAAELMQNLADAVDYSHEQGVLHRDLKPSNVLFTKGRDVKTAKISDFGLAKILDSEQSEFRSLTNTGGILGTPGYMAPEQVEGEGSAGGRETDIYGLGAILYGILAGRPPYRGRYAIETLQLVRQGQLMRPSQHRPDAHIDAGLEAICLKCLSRESSARYHSGRELAADLEKWRAGKTPQARLEEKIHYRRRLLAFAGAGTALALAGACARYFSISQQPDPAPVSDPPTETPAVEEVFIRPQDASWRVLKPGDAIEVDCDYVALLGLGNSVTGDFTLEFRLSPKTANEQWDRDGAVGIFFAYGVGPGPAADSQFTKYKSVELNSDLAGQFILRKRDLRGVQDGSRSPRHSAEVSSPQGLLRIESKAGKEAEVYWDGIPAKWGAGRSWRNQASVGKFGIYCHKNSARFFDIVINGDRLSMPW